MTVAALYRRLAARLHRVASILNQRAYRLDHGVERFVVDSPGPLRRLQAEIRQSIRDRELDAAERGQGAVAVTGCEIRGQHAEDLANQGDGHPLADRSSVDHHDLYLRWLKFIEHRPGWQETHANAVRRLSAEEKAALQNLDPQPDRSAA